MGEYISREAAIKAVCDCSAHTCKMGECFNSCNEAKALSSIPAADVVEVVRCGECKYWEHRPDRQYDLCAYLIGAKFSRTPEDFCSRGERKGGQDDA